MRRAATRLAAHWQPADDLRSGRLDRAVPDDPRGCLAKALEQCARTGTIPATAQASRVAAAAGQQSLPALLHLTSGEAWGFAVLVVSLTGLNSSVALVHGRKPREAGRVIRSNTASWAPAGYRFPREFECPVPGRSRGRENGVAGRPPTPTIT